MADRTTVWLTVYGKVPRILVPALLAAAEEDDARDNETEGEPTEQSIIDGFVAHECNWGMMNALPALCEEHRIPYRMTWADGGSYGPGVTVFDGQEHRSAGVVDGEPALAYSEILKVENLAQGWAKLIQDAKFFADEHDPAEIVDAPVDQPVAA